MVFTFRLEVEKWKTASHSKLCLTEAPSAKFCVTSFHLIQGRISLFYGLEAINTSKGSRIRFQVNRPNIPPGNKGT